MRRPEGLNASPATPHSGDVLAAAARGVTVPLRALIDALRGPRGSAGTRPGPVAGWQ